MQTGASTPHSAASLRPLTLSHGSIEHTLLVPTSLYFNCSQLKELFTKTLPEPTEGFAGDDEPSSPTELLAAFLGFTASLVTEQSGQFVEALQLILKEFETRYLRTENVHTIAAALQTDEEYPSTPAKTKSIIKSYYLARIAAKRPIKPQTSALFKAGLENVAQIYAIFGGQGNTEDYFEELRDLYQTYEGLIFDFLKTLRDHLLTLSRQNPDTAKIYTKGFDFLQWLEKPDNTPETDYLLSISVSCPLICVIQLAHYAVTCQVLGIHPGLLRDCLKGATGHSQGLITAVAISSSSDWDSFYKESIKAITTLFYIGVRCLQTYPNTEIPPSTVEDSIEAGEGKPYPMMSIRDLTIDQVQSFIDKTNRHLPEDKHVAISLVNGARNLVVSGPPQSLYGLNLTLRKEKAETGLDQARVPFSERKLRFINRFLPITSPFHSHLLAPAIPVIVQDLTKAQVEFPPENIKIPVYDTFDGQNLAQYKGSVMARIIELICVLPVNWETATKFQATHILDFGPGGISGLGNLTQRNKDGTGVRVILAGVLDGAATNPEFGYLQELFDQEEHAIKWAPNWVKEFSPKLVRAGDANTIYVDTKFSRLLGKPPLMVPGMTPTTIHADFVAATMNAGYNIEIAGGGYFEPNSMQRSLEEIVRLSKIKGDGISINMIYVNPRMLQWGIPLIKRLRSQGFPIQGLTIGAGVPSLEVATEYITELGLKYLGLKPGSVDAIQACITIAKTFPEFPVVVQWTGGRGGGHHSFEDFHAPILQMYSKLRRHSNIILIAGSGFGGAEDSYKYLTGSWSTNFDYPAMPFDGVLFGSRVMTAKEAHTSPNSKLAITQAPGVPDKDWEKTYKGPAGGVITVLSEMGEPIHKLATRGVIFWAELDKTIFNLPKNKMVEALLARKDYIIQKLNADYQKTWFGKNAAGEPCDLDEMTYIEIVKRLIELMYVKKEKRWIDVSLRNFCGDFIRRLEERFFESRKDNSNLAVLQNFVELEDPEKVVEKLISVYPEAESQLVNAQDRDYFLMLTLRPTQKPVPFIPVLDANFDFYFKKDSLWQSEDLAAVVGEDVQRTCILHGPVAAQYTNKVDEPIKEILDGINNGIIERLLADTYEGDRKKIPSIEYFGNVEPVKVDYPATVKNGDTYTYSIGSEESGAELPALQDWIKLLAGGEYNWRHAFFSSKNFIQGTKHESNPTHRVFAPSYDMDVVVSNASDAEKTVISLYHKVNGAKVKVVEVRKKQDQVVMELIETRTADHKPVALPLLYVYNSNHGFAPISEIMEDRNDRIKKFYWELWFGASEKFDINSLDCHGVFDGGEYKVTAKEIAEFTHAVGNNGEDFVSRVGKVTYAPMDFAIVAGWKAIMKAIFPKDIDGDLLKLVHLSNGFRMIPGATPMKDGDVVSTTASIRAVVNQPSGKMVEVVGTIFREGEPIMEVTSQFLYRGTYVDYNKTFQSTQETPRQVHLSSAKDVAVLKSKEWFQLDDSEIDLLNQTLTFRLTTHVTYKNETVFSSVVTKGSILLELPSNEVRQIGEVNYEAGESHGNPVLDYLERNGNTIEQPVNFENAIPLNGATKLIKRSPASNEPYAVVSGDYNPIHVNPVFANYASLKGTITHGMYSSAAVRSLVEVWAANNVASRVRAFNCNFVGMVLPNENIETKLEHIGMINGRKIIKVESVNTETGEPVLVGEAEVDQPVSTYVFTGQGSQEQGMGMDLYETSEVAREVWNRADQHFLNNYGFSILDIVKNNPKQLTIHFGGVKGNRIRDNYKSMMFETVNAEGNLVSEKIFKEITDESTSYTFVSDTGLLSATQFTQPALTLMEKASFEDLKSRGLVPADTMFAGHSLGEYSALASLGDVMPIESLVDVVFYRGLTMQVAVPRDSLGRSNYGMCAINPSRVSSSFNDAALRFVVEHIAEQTKWLLEIVNYNVENQQYVAAGDLRALDTMTNVLNVIKLQKIDIVALQEKMSLEKVKEHLSEIVEECSKKSIAKPQPIDLERGFAVIPLKGISVPFHSSYLRNGVKPFQRFLIKKIPKSAIRPNNLVGKYIPNLTAKPFEITKEYFQDVYKLTDSDKIKSILDNWEQYESN